MSQLKSYPTVSWLRGFSYHGCHENVISCFSSMMDCGPSSSPFRSAAALHPGLVSQLCSQPVTEHGQGSGTGCFWNMQDSFTLAGGRPICLAVPFLELCLSGTLPRSPVPFCLSSSGTRRAFPPKVTPRMLLLLPLSLSQAFPTHILCTSNPIVASRSQRTQ